MNASRTLTAAFVAPVLVGVFATPLPADSAAVRTRVPQATQRATLSPHPALRGATRIGLNLRTPTGCTSTYTSFVGLPTAANYADKYSAVAGGSTDEACDYWSFVGAGQANTVGGSDDAYQTAIVAGAYNGAVTSAASAIVSGYGNLLSFASPYRNSDLSFIGAGSRNQIASPGSFIGSGYDNQVVPSNGIATNGQSAFIGAGLSNRNGGNFASIVGGDKNSLGGAGALGQYGFIGGGQTNTLTGEWAALAGGDGNKVSGAAAFVGAGSDNIASGDEAVVAGGAINSATGNFATIPGGGYNTASGPDSFAAGTNSWAATTGSFVWSDAAGGAKQLKSSAVNEFLVRASGGVVLYSNPTLTSGVRLAPGGGSWASLSDRTVKTDIRPLDGAAVLAKVAALPVSEWTYRSEPGVRHVGPMAQDFYAAFKVGEDDRHITTIDEDGVALAAVKALNVKLADNVRALNAQNRALSARLARIEARLSFRHSRGVI
jgi:hypothetical protein